MYRLDLVCSKWIRTKSNDTRNWYGWWRNWMSWMKWCASLNANKTPRHTNRYMHMGMTRFAYCGVWHKHVNVRNIYWWEFRNNLAAFVSEDKSRSGRCLNFMTWFQCIRYGWITSHYYTVNDTWKTCQKKACQIREKCPLHPRGSVREKWKMEQVHGTPSAVLNH